MPRSITPALALAAPLLAAGCSITPDSGVAPTPQRPTLSSDTSTTAEGTFEVEAGFVRDNDESLDLPVTLKYGYTADTELFVGGSPLRSIDSGGVDDQGFGDLVVGLRHRVREETEDRPSIAVQSLVKLPTADHDQGLGSGEIDAVFAGIVTKGLEGSTLTGYYSLGFIGDPAGATDLSHSLALAASSPLDGEIGLFSEIAGVFTPGADVEALFATGGLTYAASPTAVLDVGVSVGLSSDAPDWQFLIGFTRNLGVARRERR